jgi:hypothetical protein
MIRNALIAIYILVVLAISAVSRAESEISGNIIESKHHVRPVLILTLWTPSLSLETQIVK